MAKHHSPRPKKRRRKPSGDQGHPSYPNRERFESEAPPDPVSGGDRVRPPEPGKWSKQIQKWLDRREHERDDHEVDECGRPVRRRRKPRPWLDATSNFGPQITAFRVDEPGQVSFTVWNEGSFPAWTCYVELYEGPGGYTTPLSGYELRGRTIITLHPGERREVVVPWVRKQKTGRIVGVVYDPLLDPRDFTEVEQFNRHITSVHYTNLG